jgi:hypothetical protein
MVMIDVHAHLYDERYLGELRALLASPQTNIERASARTLERTLSIPANWQIDQRVELMDRIGLDCQVLSVSIPFTYDGDLATRSRPAQWSNDRLASTIARGRLLRCPVARGHLAG